MRNKMMHKVKKRIWKRVLSVTLAAALLMTAVPVDVNAENETTAEIGTEGVSGNTGVVTDPAGTTVTDMTLKEPVYVTEATVGNIFDNTTITLEELTLKATYKDETGKTVVETLSQDGTFELPYNADINMRLDFRLGDGTALEDGKIYTYKLPDSIRVDVEADHELSDSSKNSIGKVHISKDGTLSFEFYKDQIGNNTNVNFYVQFEGGFSENLQEAGKEEQISFPTASGDFNITIQTTDKTGETEEPELSDVGISKSGSRIINADGKNYIEWTVELAPNGRDALNGVIVDNLPAGLTYAAVAGYPKTDTNGTYAGDITTTAQDGDTKVEIKLTDVKTYYHTQVKFCTYYDATAFGGTIDNNTSQLIDNTAIFNPDDEDKGVSDSGTVTIKPDMLEKSGTSIDADGNITWTVVINREKLNLQGATYQDTVGAGQTLDYSSITMSPDGLGTLSQTADGFQVDFLTDAEVSDTVTITYKTKVTDFSQSNYQNKAELTGGTDVVYDISKDASVPGYKLFDKNVTGFNSVSNTLTWQIVINESGALMENVVVTDWFAAGDRSNLKPGETDDKSMVFVSASEPLDASSDPDNGKLVFKFDSLTEKKIITIETRIENPENYNETDWLRFANHANMTSSLNPSPLEDTAERYIQITKPDMLDKWGELSGKGTVKWGITIKEPQLAMEGMTFTDVLPENMEYIPGSFLLQNMYYDPAPLYREPVIGEDAATGRQTITYTLTDDGGKEGEFFNKAFQIFYKTKVTDPDKAAENNSYTNKAEITVEYEGNVIVKDDDAATVTGEVGGVLDKTFSYKPGNQYVDWTVAINEGRNDMSAIDQPKITDQLADYFDYMEGTLYKVDRDDNETEVASSEYIVSVVNGKLIVQLPNIGSDCYRFKFKTQFNCLAAELEGQTIKNTVAFTGSGKTYSKESDSINNVSFSSSSAGAVVKREIRIKKVDAATKAPLSGAKFQLYLGTECIGEAESGADGYAVFENLNSITGYTLKLCEIQAPDGYKIDGTGELEITDYTEENLKTDNNGTKYYEVEVENTSTTTVETGDIKVKKTNTDGVLLSGAVFGLYRDAACQDEITTRTTVDGLAAFSGLEQGTYYLKEISSPAGYKVSPDIVTVVIAKNGDVIEVSYGGTIGDSHTFVDEKAVGNLKIIKKEKDAAMVLPGASFSLYKDALCTDRIDTQVTDAAGAATFTNLELGRTYYYRETAAPAGYVLDHTIHEITVGAGTETTDQTETVTVENQKAIGNIVVTKVDNSVIAKPLSGVTFQLLDKDGNPVLKDGVAYEVTSDDNGIAIFEDIPFGDYKITETEGKTGYKVSADVGITVDIVGDNPVTIVNSLIQCNIKVLKQDAGDASKYLSGAEIGLFTKAGVQVKKGTTNAAGEVIFYDIPYGDYYLKELKAPDGYKLTDTLIDITAAEITAGDGATIQRSFENEKQNGKIRLTKTDDAALPLSGAEFTLYDKNMAALATVKSMTAAEALAAGTGAVEGSAEFTELAYGTYYLQETKAPDGYLRDTTVYKVLVNSDDYTEVYTKDDSTTAALTISNDKLSTTPPLISVKVKKTDSKTGAALADATFEIYKDGNPTGFTAVTGSDGIAYFKRISVENDSETSAYTIVETAAPAGYKLTAGSILLGQKTALNPYADADTTPLTEEQIQWAGLTQDKGTVKNEPVKGSIWITKSGLTTNILLAGAEFTLYEADKTTKVTIAGLNNPAVTNASGVAAFDNLPCGTYYVKETKAPKGYTINSTETKVVITDETPVQVSLKDTPINVSVSKQAVGGVTEIAGAVFEITKKNDPEHKIIDSWTSAYAPHRILPGALEVGTTYVLSEKTAPAGYGYMSDVEFTINNDGSISTAAEKNGQTMIVRDLPVTLFIGKQDADTGSQLAGAKLALYDAQGTKLTEFTSGMSAYELPLGMLSVPKTGYLEYTLKELTAPDGYELANPIIFAVSADGKVYQVEENAGSKNYLPLAGNLLIMQDVEKKATDIYIKKMDADTGTELAGADFAIYETNGGATPIVSWISDGLPHKLEKALFTTDTVYTLKEESAPAGYLMAADIQFKLNAAGEIEIVNGSADNLNGDKDTILVRDQELELKIRKQNSFGTLLKGATLRIVEYDASKPDGAGTEIVRFVTDNRNVYTALPKDLNSDATYILQELDAPAGYKMAEDIVFTIAADGKITRQDGVPVYHNTIVMEDEEAGLGIGKLSIEGREGLAGSKLTLTSQDDPYFTTQTWVSDGHVKTWELTDFTPGCTYTLTEIEAPAGYAYADPITFTIDADDHQIYIDGQRVDDRTVYIEDGKLELSVSKQDLYEKTELAGAVLGIFDDAGQLVTSFTSGATPHMVDTGAMIAGNTDYQEYVLREIEAPAGYRKAADIRFAIDRDGAVYLVTEDGAGGKQYTAVDGNRLTMYDAPMLSVRKLNPSGDLVEGAKLSITAKDDTAFTPITWISGKSPYYVQDGLLTPGVTYILREEEAPVGYAYAKELEFMLDAEGRLIVDGEPVENMRIVMLDYPITVSVSKQDAGSRQELAGAKLVIKNEAGEIIHSFVSDTTAVTLPFEIFTAPKQGALGYYTLCELEAPAGYAVAADIAFAIDSEGRLYLKNEQGGYALADNNTVVMLDAANGSDTTTPGRGNSATKNHRIPKTGDETPLGMLIALCVGSLIGAGAMFGGYFYKKRRR